MLRCYFAIILFLLSGYYASGQCILTVTDDTVLCKINPSVQLHAKTDNALYYIWEPANTLSDPNIPNPVARPDRTTLYKVTSLVLDPIELVNNGGFEQGNKDFTSSYTLVEKPEPGTRNLDAGEYTINTSPANVHSCFDNCRGNGNIMIVNGASQPNIVIWSQTIKIDPNTEYAFSAWLANVTCGGGTEAALQFSINGQLIGDIFNSATSTCLWKRFFCTWHSGNSDKAVISIVNQSTLTNGNDFTLDNISFRKACTLTDSVKLTVNYDYIRIYKDVCVGDSFFVAGKYQTKAGVYYDSYTNNRGCDSLIRTQLEFIYHQVDQNLALCAGDSMFVRNNYVKTGGYYYDTAKSAITCDSVIRTFVYMVLPNQKAFSADICEGDSFLLNKKYLKNTGMYLDTLYRAHCIDTLLHLTLTVHKPPTLTRNFSRCHQDSFFFHDQYWRTDTVFIDKVHTGGTCDSIYVTQLKFRGNPLDLIDTATYCKQDIAVIDAGDYASYLWSDGSTQRFFYTDAEGIYKVSVIDSNNCKYSDTTVVAERCKPLFFVPNSFTPNGNGVNDFFTISTHNVYEMDFKIIDRWGEVVYETQDPRFAWDGNYKNKALPIGVYQWTGTFVGRNKGGYTVRENSSGLIMILQ